MDTSRFDSVARLFGSGMTRREALRGLVAGAAAVTAGGALLHVQVEDASAKKRKKTGGGCRLINCKPGFRCRNGKCRPHGKPSTTPGLPEGAACSQDGQCNSSEQLICEIPYGAGNSDRACCRGTGATCGPNLHCCTGEQGGREFQCVNSTCQPFVEP
ncbi:MAG: hypothetical protein KY456_16365 [Chloroflexi bacterium]|nr:hypothetical protein [Chloroflexota bacterium]